MKFINFYIILTFFLNILANKDQHTSLTWPKGNNSPYKKLKFSENICYCSSLLNEINSGCLNITSGEIINKTCIDKPYWGLVFIWWGIAAFFIGGITTTSFTIISDLWKTIMIYCFNQRKNQYSNQVVDVHNYKNES